MEAELTGLANTTNYFSSFLYPINEMKRVENSWPKYKLVSGGGVGGAWGVWWEM